jgi:hypothetical protein
VAVVGSLVWVATPLAAQEAGEAAPVSEPRPAYAPQWSDADVAAVAELLTGTWISTGGVSDLAGESSRQVMTIAPAPVEGVPNTLYVESAREGSLDMPFRHAMFELVPVNGQVRLRTLELIMTAQSKGMLTGLGLVPEWFPSLQAEDLIVSSEVVLSRSGSGWKGKTAHPFPTRLGGALEMTTALELTPGRFVATDTGMEADGSTAWGGEAVAFERFDGGPAVTRRDDGMVIIEYVNPGEPVAELDRIHARYTGWLEDTTVFDSNRRDDRDAFIFAYPPGNRAIAGWGIGMEGVSVGTKRKLIIPGPLAYAERGNPRAGIGPNEPLYFELEIAHIERYTPPEEAPTPEGQPGQGTDPQGGAGQD